MIHSGEMHHTLIWSEYCIRKASATTHYPGAIITDNDLIISYVMLIDGLVYILHNNPIIFNRIEVHQRLVLCESADILSSFY
jgi:hypothetical protein